MWIWIIILIMGNNIKINENFDTCGVLYNDYNSIWNYFELLFLKYE
jgi:hypothetical protein